MDARSQTSVLHRRGIICTTPLPNTYLLGNSLHMKFLVLPLGINIGLPVITQEGSV